jgi:putative flippase GtrA
MVERSRFLPTFGRHQIGSIVASIIDFSTMTLAVSALGLDAVVGTVIGAALGAAVNFSMGRYWIFASTRDHPTGQVVRYAAVSAGSLVLNAVGEYELHDRLHIQYQLARLCVALGVSVLWNYPMQRHFVFRPSVASV